MPTPEEKRQQIISNAIYAHDLNKPDWFEDIHYRISLAIRQHPDDKAMIVLAWVKSCEAVEGTIIKQEILKVYDSRETKSGDQD